MTSKKKLLDCLNYAVNNTQYYAKYKGMNFDELPVLYKKDYQKNSYPKSNEMVVEGISNCFVFSTSGTTSEPQYIIRDLADIEYQINDYIGLNIGVEDVVLNLFWGGLWGIYTTANVTLSKTGATIVPFGGNNITDMNAVAKLISDFKVNVLFGVPSTIVNIAHYYSKLKMNPTINKVFCLGEKMDSVSYEYIKSVFIDCTIKTKYGCMESAGIGYQCECLNRNEYHIFNNRYVELLTDDNQPVQKEGDIGRIIVTTLNRRKVPLLRYDTGDMGYFETRRCACGQEKVLTVLGRNDNELIVASVHLKKNEMDQLIINNAANYAGHQIVVSKLLYMDYMRIIISCSSFDEAKFLKKLYENSPDLFYVIDNKKMNNIEFVYNSDTMKRNLNSGKIQRYVDLR